MGWSALLTACLLLALGGRCAALRSGSGLIRGSYPRRVAGHSSTRQPTVCGPEPRRCVRRRRIKASAVTAEGAAELGLEFDHVEVCVPSLRPVSEYRLLEAAMDDFVEALCDAGLWRLEWYGDAEVAAMRSLFPESGRELAAGFEASDLVAQMICGLNWRIAPTCTDDDDDDESVRVGPPAASFVVSASSRARAFCRGKAGRAGIGALAFRCRSLDAVRAAYPAELGVPQQQQPTGRRYEAYAYREPGGGPDNSSAVLRFVPQPLEPSSVVPSDGDTAGGSVRFDHWVSNVRDRGLFVDTMATLGLTPRVEFDAGVISAGRASIESTVLGGDAVYLPVNNALSPVGHVAAFLDQVGQGVQHIASRVDDLVAFVSTARALKEATGRGFDFLDVPRSYYGTLRPDDAALPVGLWDALRDRNIIDDAGLVTDLDLDDRALAAAAPDLLADRPDLARLVSRSRYANLEAVLGDRLRPDDYIKIVKARILVDVQGPDALLQIFTTNVLQRQADHEAPFLEFIQRVCGADGGDVHHHHHQQQLGCGGFGIRNFLALFLSIELNAAMQQLRTAESPDRAAKARAKIDCLATQLDLANPLLDAIARAGLEEAALLDSPLPDEAALEAARLRKAEAQAELQALSAEFARRADEIDSMPA